MATLKLYQNLLFGHILGLCKGHEKANYSFWMFSTNAFFIKKPWNIEQARACKIVLCIVWHHLNIESSFYQYFL
jgi:hypothetical protein